MRPPDEVWNALIQECGANPKEMTRNERGKYNLAVKQLKEAGATGPEIHKRARVYRQKFPNIHFTALGLVNHWSSCASASPYRPPLPASVEAEPEPDITPEQRAENIRRLSEMVKTVAPPE